MTEMSSLLKRHAAFWRHDDTDQALVRMRPRGARPRLENMDVTPDLIDVELFTQEVGKRDQHSALVQGDLFHGECAFSRVPWMEALVGCEIHAGADEAMWARPALGPNYEGMERIVPGEDNPWLRILLALTQALVDANDGSYLVTHTLQRGPSDMLSALLGDSRMGLAIYDEPEQVNEVLMRCTETFIQVARAQYALIPPFHGGWAPWAYGLWAPGSVVRFQSDSASQFSPRTYREHILPHDRKIMQAFDYSIIDLHSAGTLHLHKVLLDVEELSAISVTLDGYENAPRIKELISTFAAILERKSLSLFGEMTEQEVDLLLRELPPRGLSINGTLVDKLLFERKV
jgi:hypothetical protein